MQCLANAIIYLFMYRKFKIIKFLRNMTFILPSPPSEPKPNPIHFPIGCYEVLMSELGRSFSQSKYPFFQAQSSLLFFNFIFINLF